MDVSVVIVSYNVKDLLQHCLQSIKEFTKDIQYEVIVVDNGSTDGSVEYLRSLTDIKFIEAGENLGFAKGNNLALRLASGKYVLFLNPDTLLEENAIGRMFLWMEGHKDYAVSSCQLIDSEHKISPTGGYFPSLLKVFAWAMFLDDLPIFSRVFLSYHPHTGEAPWGSFFRDSLSFLKQKKDDKSNSKISSVYNYDKEFDPDWVTGAFFMVRKEVIDKVGNLDEHFFMYGEEMEWCMRFRKAGWKVGYTPLTKITHLERKSSGGLPKNAVLGEFRGLKYIYGKYYPPYMQIILGSILDLAAFARVIFWLVRRKPEMVKIYLEAFKQ